MHCDHWESLTDEYDEIACWGPPHTHVTRHCTVCGDLLEEECLSDR